MIAYFQSIIIQCRNPVFLVAQILGFIPVILGFFVFGNRSRRSSITIKAFADFSAAVHFALLTQWTGFAICLVNTARGICFSQRQQKKWASGNYMPVLFCGLTVLGSALGWTGPESLLPMLGSCLAVMGYWSIDTHKLRLFNLAGISLWLVYGIFTFSVSTVINNAAYIISILRTEWMLYRKKYLLNNDLGGNRNDRDHKSKRHV